MSQHTLRNASGFSAGKFLKSELSPVFPEGVKHLPETLKPREIYPTARNSSAKVQYVGKAEKFGFNLVL